MSGPAPSNVFQRLLPFTIAAWLSIAGCTTGGAHTSWITVGTTTKDDVRARYGEPDSVRVSADGETATYRPAAGPPPVAVPVMRPGPSGLVTTQTEPVRPGLGVRNIAGGADDRPPYEVEIRYDARGIVREVRP